MTTMEQVRAIPPAGSGTSNQVPKRSGMSVGSEYAVPEFAGSSYIVHPREYDEVSAADRLVALLAAAREVQLERPDYPDSPDQVQERSDLTHALYQLQVQTISSEVPEE
jgi:hypothetical protein